MFVCQFGSSHRSGDRSDALADTLGDGTLVYPGHLYAPEGSGSLGEEKRTNPYLRVASLEQFLAFMGR